MWCRWVYIVLGASLCLSASSAAFCGLGLCQLFLLASVETSRKTGKPHTSLCNAAAYHDSLLSPCCQAPAVYMDSSTWHRSQVVGCNPSSLWHQPMCHHSTCSGCHSAFEGTALTQSGQSAAGRQAQGRHRVGSAYSRHTSGCTGANDALYYTALWPTALTIW